MCSTSSSTGYIFTGTACSSDSHVFSKGKPDCRCGVATRAACPECGREFETEGE